MKRIHLAILVAAIALSSASLAAQQTHPAAAKKGSPQNDSLKSVKKSIKAEKSALKRAKASGDTAKAKSLKKQLKAEKKTKAALKIETGKAPVKKP